MPVLMCCCWRGAITQLSARLVPIWPQGHSLHGQCCVPVALEPVPVRNNPSGGVCVCVAESVRNTPSTDTMPAASAVPSAELPEPEGPFLPAEEEPQGPPTAHVRPSHPLKSFAVPSAGGPFDPALPSTPLLTQQGEPQSSQSVGMSGAKGGQSWAAKEMWQRLG